MASDSKVLVDIDDLYLNFYTKAGVVKALDGIDLTIYKGETLGLVGESGCGKSATANSIMRLVPSPPGKIESGRIMFFMDDELVERQKNIEAIAEQSGDLPADLEQEKENLQDQLSALEVARKKWVEYRLLKKQKGKDDPEVAAALERLSEELAQYDIVTKPAEELRAVRGNAISMIFQEPMTSLNPVFTAGEQISEVMLLHEPRQLAAAAIQRMDAIENALNEGKRAKMVMNGKGKPSCSECGTELDGRAELCPDCGSYLGSKSASQIRFQNSSGRRYMRKVINDPHSFELYLTGKLPILRRYKKLLEREAMERAIDVLKLVKVPDPVNVARSYPYELSGGMQQRVMIAMALVCRPQLLIADEPTTALDVTIQAQILKLMRELQTEMDTTILMITHNLGIIAEICDRVGVMYAGTMAEICETDELFREPLHPYTQGLLYAIPRTDQDLPRLETIEGAVPNLVKPPSGCRFHPRCPYAMPICSQEKPKMMAIRPNHHVACHLYQEGSK
jgi:peptide/nickel transport system ATP-binding protein